MRTNILSKIALCVLSVAFCFLAITCGKENEAKPAPKVDKIGKDGAPMVLIQAGDFQMGTDPSEIPTLVLQYEQYGIKSSWCETPQHTVYDYETPRHTVYVDAFYMDIYEVTNAQYKKFMDATGHSTPTFWSDTRYNIPNQPVVVVLWQDAVAYSEWAGKRLPTEAEWEKAARGGLVGKKYPWGDSEPDGTQCNFADRNIDVEWSGKSVDDGYEYPAPVGSYRANGYGLYDMAGNVWEWCADWYDHEYYVNSPRRNPKGADSANGRVLRGGSYYDGASGLRAADRGHYDPGYADSVSGFRCVVVSQD